MSVLPGGAPSGLVGQGVLTGSKGETLTFTRATTKTVTDATGKVYTVSSGQPGIDAQGFSVEAAHTNVALRSQEFDNATWADSAVGVSAPTITANAGLAPDGTNTADRFDIPAVGTNQVSAKAQGLTASAALYTFSIWAKAVSPGSQTYIYIIDDATGLTNYSLLIAPSTTAWTRYSITSGANLSAVTWDFDIGVRAVASTNMVAQSAASILFWGAQVETGGYPHSYAATTTGSATVNKDSATFAATTLPVSAGALRFTAVPLFGTANQPTNMAFIDTRAAGASNGIAVILSSGFLGFLIQATTACSVTGLSWVAGAPYRILVVWAGGNVWMYRNDILVASDTTGAVTMPPAHTILRIGDNRSQSAPADCYISDIQWFTQ